MDKEQKPANLLAAKFWSYRINHSKFMRLKQTCTLTNFTSEKCCNPWQMTSFCVCFCQDIM